MYAAKKVIRCLPVFLSDCLSIAQEVTLVPGKSIEQGFLLNPPNESEFRRFLSEQALWVCQTGNEIVGFAVAYPRLSPLYKVVERGLPMISWEDTVVKTLSHLVYIDKVATRPRDYQRGVARSLYEHLFKEFPESGFWAAIAQHPYRNVASTAFHLRMGFRRVGVCHAEEFAGLCNYKSEIYFKSALRS